MKTHTSHITRLVRLAGLFAACGLLTSALAQPATNAPREPRESRKGGAKSRHNAVALTPNQPAPPLGFDVPRAGIARGKISSFEYGSKAGGGTFCATVYTPPKFSPDKKYPVLYLLHGASGDENTWQHEIQADTILNNLYADKKLEPMIVVMPSSLSVAARAQAGDDRDAKARAGMAFGNALLRDLIPFVESKYPVLAGREHRAIAGLSMGAGVALGTGLAHPDQFAWVGAFSGGSTRRLADRTRLDVTSPGRQLRLLWISVGAHDTMMTGSAAAVDAFLTEKNIPHLFRINEGAHEPKVWMSDLYYFAPMLFKNPKDATAGATIATAAKLPLNFIQLHWSSAP